MAVVLRGQPEVCDDRSKAYGELTAIQCDILLLNSLEIRQVIRQKAETAECLKQTKLLLFAMKEDPECFLQAVRLGASGYLLNEASSTEIIAAVRVLRKDKQFALQSFASRYSIMFQKRFL